jgi:hypothetical protein
MLMQGTYCSPDNQPMVTEHIKTVLKENYNYDSTARFTFRLSTADLDLRLSRIRSGHYTAPSPSVVSLKTTET